MFLKQKKKTNGFLGSTHGKKNNILNFNSSITKEKNGFDYFTSFFFCTLLWIFFEKHFLSFQLGEKYEYKIWIEQKKQSVSVNFGI